MLTKNRKKSTKISAFTLAEGATHVAMSDNHRKAAFTLAEVLVTLSIIGVVAAITLPALIRNYQKHAYVNQLKTTYSILQNGFKMMLADEGVERLEDTSVFQSIGGTATAATNGNGDTYRLCQPSVARNKDRSDSVNCKEFYNNLKKYFKIVDIIDIEGTDQSAVDAGISCKYLNKGNTKHSVSVTAFRLSNGATILPDAFYSNPYKYLEGGKPYPYGGSLGSLDVDINGSKGPNQWGRDTFNFYIANNGTLIPYGSKAMGLLLQNDENFHWWKTTTVIASKCTTSETTNGYGCAGRIIDEGWKMNY